MLELCHLHHSLVFYFKVTLGWDIIYVQPSDSLKEMKSFREKLPAFKMKSEFLKAVQENQVGRYFYLLLQKCLIYHSLLTWFIISLQEIISIDLHGSKKGQTLLLDLWVEYIVNMDDTLSVWTSFPTLYLTVFELSSIAVIIGYSYIFGSSTA